MLDYKESWALKNWLFWTVVLEKTLESPLDCREIQPVHPKGNQSWIFIGWIDAEAETEILWPPDAKDWLLGRKAMTNLDSILKSRHYFANKGPPSQSYGLSSSHVWMWELDYKESWVPKNWCFWTVVLEKTLESPLDCKEIQSVHSKANQSGIFIGSTDAEAETPILWPPDVKNWLIGKEPDAGKDWRREEKGMTEDEMVEWHHRLDGHEFE